MQCFSSRSSEHELLHHLVLTLCDGPCRHGGASIPTGIAKGRGAKGGHGPLLIGELKSKGSVWANKHNLPSPYPTTTFNVPNMPFSNKNIKNISPPSLFPAYCSPSWNILATPLSIHIFLETEIAYAIHAKGREEMLTILLWFGGKYNYDY